MADTLDGKVALVTGGSRGIGRHIAAALRSAGAEVAITGRDRTTLDPTAAEIDCRPFVCDQRDEAAVRELARAVESELGPLDILVNNAASFLSRPVVSTTLAEWNDVLETNLTGVFLITRAFLPAMIEEGRGDIFLIGSMSGKKGDPNAAAYCASKFGLAGFAQSLLHEVRRNNIRVMILAPSAVDTGPQGREEGPGLYLHAADIATTVVDLARLPGRTLVRDIEMALLLTSLTSTPSSTTLSVAGSCPPASASSTPTSALRKVICSKRTPVAFAI